MVADERALVAWGTAENKALFFLAASALRVRRVTPLETNIVDDVDDGQKMALLAVVGVPFRFPSFCPNLDNSAILCHSGTH